MPTINFLKFWLPLIAWMGIIFLISSLPAKDVPPLFPFQDIVYHLIAYTILGYLFRRAAKKNIRLALIFGIAYALSDEFHQVFVPGRTFSGFDLIIDGVGVFLGSLRYQ